MVQASIISEPKPVGILVPKYHRPGEISNIPEFKMRQVKVPNNFYYRDEYVLHI